MLATHSEQQDRAPAPDTPGLAHARQSAGEKREPRARLQGGPWQLVATERLRDRHANPTLRKHSAGDTLLLETAGELLSRSTENLQSLFLFPISGPRGQETPGPTGGSESCRGQGRGVSQHIFPLDCRGERQPWFPVFRSNSYR